MLSCCLSLQWHALSREEQAKYYELARKERQLHMQLYPGWSARDNYVSAWTPTLGHGPEWPGGLPGVLQTPAPGSAIPGSTRAIGIHILEVF